MKNYFQKLIIMKKLFILLLALSGASFTFVNAQSPETNIREKMKAFESWIGHWQGEGQMQMGPGEPKKSTVDEHIESKLDGTILLVEGIGTSENPSTHVSTVVHHALGVLSYNPGIGQYRFITYLKDGHSADAWLMPTGENKFQWGFDIPNRGKTRYSITLDPELNTWNEIGEFSADGTNWSKFFEMNLKKSDG